MADISLSDILKTAEMYNAVKVDAEALAVQVNDFEARRQVAAGAISAITGDPIETVLRELPGAPRPSQKTRKAVENQGGGGPALTSGVVTSAAPSVLAEAVEKFRGFGQPSEADIQSAARPRT